MPTAGRVSRPLGVVVGGVERGRVVCGTVVCGADELAGAGVVTGVEGLLVVVVAGAGAVRVGCGVAIGAGGAGGGAITAGGGGAGGVVDSADVLSTLVGVSLDSEAERRALTPKNHANTTTMIVPASAAVCSNRRLFAAASSPTASDTVGSTDGVAS
jgi:hypothetical protein